MAVETASDLGYVVVKLIGPCVALPKSLILAKRGFSLTNASLLSLKPSHNRRLTRGQLFVYWLLSNLGYSYEYTIVRVSFACTSVQIPVQNLAWRYIDDNIISHDNAVYGSDCYRTGLQCIYLFICGPNCYL